MLKTTYLKKMKNWLQVLIFEVWVGLTLEHQVNVDNYEGQTRRFFYLPFNAICCPILGLLNGQIGLLKACVL